MNIAVIDNGGQYTHRIMRTFQDLEYDSEILPNTTPIEELSADAVAFSGSGLSVGGGEEFGMGNCELYLDKFNGPILGMCAGHQLIAKHFGGEAKPAGTPEYGITELIIDEPDELFKGLPSTIKVWNSHNDEVTAISDQLKALAHSKDCPYEAIRHVSKPIFGVQFHPEVQHTEHGAEIFKNFAELTKV
ncbi:MAG: GMP synthase subunit A [archaeon]